MSTFHQDFHSGSSCRLVTPLVVYKVFVFLFIFLTQQMLPFFFWMEGYKGNFHYPPDVEPTPICMYKTWDGQQYLFLSEQGYYPGIMPTAFYPLYPFLIRAVAPLFGSSHLVSGLVLSNLFSLLAIVAFYRLVASLRSNREAECSTLLLLAYPGAIFFHFVYSESLFLVLTLGLFLGIHQYKSNLIADNQIRQSGWYYLTLLCAFLLPLTRSVGILILFPLAYEVWRIHSELRSRILCSVQQEEKESPLPSPTLTGKVNLISILILLSAPLLGFASYLLIMFFATGYAFEGFRVQHLFIADSSFWKMFDVVGFVKTFFQVSSIHKVLGSLIDRIWFVFFLVGLIPLWKKERSLFLYSLVMGLVPAMMVSLMAFTRYLLVVFPIFMVYGAWLSKLRNPAWRGLIYTVLFSLQLLFLLRQINNYWVG